MSPPTNIGLATKEPAISRSVPQGRPTLLPYGGVLIPTRRVFVAFAALTLLATYQLLVVGAFTDRYFAWTISIRPTSAFLGAAYAAGFVLAVLALRRDRWRDVRVAMITVTVFTVLTLIPTRHSPAHLSSDGWRCRRPVGGLDLVGDLRRRSDRLPHRGGPAGAAAGRTRRGSSPDAPLAHRAAGRTGRHAPSGGCGAVPGRRQGAPPAGRGDGLLALEDHSVGGAGHRCLVARAGRGGGVGDLGTGPEPTAGAGGDVHRLRCVPAAGLPAVLRSGPTRLSVGMGLRGGARLDRHDRRVRLLGAASVGKGGRRSGMDD